MDWLQHKLNNTELVEGSRRAGGPDENLVYYVRETERGMMPADSELTKQLCHMTLLFTQNFYKIQINSE